MNICVSASPSQLQVKVPRVSSHRSITTCVPSGIDGIVLTKGEYA